MCLYLYWNSSAPSKQKRQKETSIITANYILINSMTDGTLIQYQYFSRTSERYLPLIRH